MNLSLTREVFEVRRDVLPGSSAVAVGWGEL